MEEISCGKLQRSVSDWDRFTMWECVTRGQWGVSWGQRSIWGVAVRWVSCPVWQDIQIHYVHVCCSTLSGINRLKFRVLVMHLHVERDVHSKTLSLTLIWFLDSNKQVKHLSFLLQICLVEFCLKVIPYFNRRPPHIEDNTSKAQICHISIKLITSL